MGNTATLEATTLFFWIAFATSLWPQAPPSEKQDFTLRTSSELVVLSVGVQDVHGKNIGGLKSDDFKVYEDGKLQPLKQFASEEQPVTVGIVVDASGSMRKKQVEVTTAALNFVKASNPEDEVFIITFNDEAFSGLPPGIAFSSDPQQLRSALLARSPEGRTALFDALALAGEHLAQGKWENKAILLISDGGDNSSSHTLNQAIETIQKSGATLYTLGLYDAEDKDQKPALLQRLARMTGGEYFMPAELAELPALCVHIAKDIRARYTLAYTPPHNPGPHKLKVLVTAGARGKLVVHNRTSYVSARE